MQLRRAADPGYRERERELNSEAMHLRRENNPAYTERERELNTAATQIRRQTDTDYREREREMNTAAIRFLRDASPLYRGRERGTNSTAMQVWRQTDVEYRTQERRANSEAMRNRRLTDPAYRGRERETNNTAMRNRRSTQETVREREQNALRMQRRREVMELRVQEQTRRQESRQQRSVYSTAVFSYENVIKEGPTQGRPMSYSDICKSFAMRYDRRVARRPDYLLFMAKKIELLKLSSNMSVCLRKKRICNRTDINAANLTNNDFIHGLVQHDDAYQKSKGKNYTFPLNTPIAEDSKENLSEPPLQTL
ncbi:unnamed protein product [Gongylonema pulchrum]|uniref:Trichohyalin-like n=1 Tax=Gongylonema pulchrum TaxID=637853 RepID=A0A183DY44_9BILA|nr:unnamed protein product [Gongylonema pulchrum]